MKAQEAKKIAILAQEVSISSIVANAASSGAFKVNVRTDTLTDAQRVWLDVNGYTVAVNSENEIETIISFEKA